MHQECRWHATARCGGSALHSTPLALVGEQHHTPELLHLLTLPPSRLSLVQDAAGMDSMQALDAAAEEAAAGPGTGTRISGFVSAGIIQQGNQEGGVGAAPAAAANPDEIDLDMGDEEEEGAGRLRAGAGLRPC